MRVLVVEDDEPLGTIFVDYLHHLGHEGVLVESAEAALSALSTDAPDAIILDVFLPGLSGLAFLQVPRVRESGLPIVVVSGAVNERQARECLRLGAMDFVPKPVELERLGDVLEAIEPYALRRLLQEPARRVEQRRAPRASVAMPVRLIEDDGSESLGTAVSLSPFSMKIRRPAALRPGRVTKLSFTPPDGGPALEVIALHVREEQDCSVFFFADVNAPGVERLDVLVARLASG